MRKVVILFGGVSAEHEVSIITGLQVIENMDRKLFIPYAIRLDKDGLFKYYENLNKRKDYLKVKSQIVNFGRDRQGAYFTSGGLLKKKIYIDIAYLAFHGGNGESGQMQGFLEILQIPYSSPNVEASSIAMNKILTKEVLEQNDIETVEHYKDSKNVKLPAIIKPVHLGSSIAINIAKTQVELKKYLLEASQVDSEVLIERLVKDFEEYNVSVRKVNGKVETSEIEKPLSTEDILSFDDKYQKGGKEAGGMASLQRELPAKVSKELEKKIKETAIKAFNAIRAKGMLRIDFMLEDKKLYLTEINPIPGSMSFYLWEASGISFKQQITDLLNQAIADNEERLSKGFEYKTNIVEKFVNNTNR
jgi:D-alanine-D-alanine ligase